MDRHRPTRHPHGCSTARKQKNGTIRPVFSAGGDVKAVYLAGKKTSDDSSLTSSFFREEYHLLIGLPHIPYPKFPCGTVSLWEVASDFPSMGNIAWLRMLERMIGLFPNVGGSWWIPRLKALYKESRDAAAAAVVGGVGNY
eukprot:CCRYP_004754-RA/>CCRYP_004754-RA protein AED:0.33 eAED:0.33 QI:0/-1/0/1/-1/1/1/0/140